MIRRSTPRFVGFNDGARPPPRAKNTEARKRQSQSKMHLHPTRYVWTYNTAELPLLVSNHTRFSIGQDRAAEIMRCMFGFRAANAS